MFGEGEGEGEGKPAVGEDGKRIPEEIEIQAKTLIFSDASKGLSHLGKDETGMRYAYLKLTVSDKKLTSIQVILNFHHLFFVDVSGNYLTLEAMQCLSQLPFLVQLKADRNFVESLEFENFPYLQDLNLAKNQIKKTTGLKQEELQFLNLNYNQIYQVNFDGDNSLPKLQELEMRGNYLFELGGNFPETVEKLFLAENRISRVIDPEFSKLSCLGWLHLRNNLVQKLNGFSDRLVNLQYLNLRQNRIRQLRKLACLPKLETLVILGNPLSGDELEKVGEEEDEEEEVGEVEEAIDRNRVKILVLLPQLKRINKIYVTYDEREAAKEKFEEYYNEIMDEASSDEDNDEGVTSTTENLTELETDFNEEEGGEEELGSNP